RPFSTLDSGQAPGLGIGNVQDPNYPLVSVFNGLIDEVRISDQALSAGQLLPNVPEPAALSSLLLSVGCGALFRRPRDRRSDRPGAAMKRSLQCVSGCK